MLSTKVGEIFGRLMRLYNKKEIKIFVLTMNRFLTTVVK